MARYWCKQCEIFVDDNKISRKHHEDSSKHKNSVIRSISKLHQKNKEIHRQTIEADKEQRKINKELGIKNDYKPVFKKKVKKDEEVEDVKEVEPNIGEWSVVEPNEPKEETIKENESQKKPPTNQSKKQLSTADLETKNWNLSKPKKLDLSDSDEEPTKKPTFKKRKIIKK